jgi:conjugal transfer pilus assembly protein TraF
MQNTLRPIAVPRYRTAALGVAMAWALTAASHAQNLPANAAPQDDIPASSGAPAAEDAEPRATYWRHHREGWFWYQDPVPTKPRAPAKTPKRSSELADFDALQKRLEDLKRIAVMNPSEANLLAYMRLQRTVMDKSQTFADRWQRLVWSVPDLDYGMTGRPTNAMAINVFDDQQRSRDAETVRALAATHGLIFVFRSDCPFCHRFAPILKRFEQEFGITVLAVSTDGGTLPDYPDARPDNGIATRLQVRSVPAVYLTQPNRREIRPVGFGLMSDSELLERVAALARDQTSDRSNTPSNARATR